MMDMKSEVFSLIYAFDKVWHSGLIYKLKQNVVTAKFLNLIISFLDARKERVLNG